MKLTRVRQNVPRIVVVSILVMCKKNGFRVYIPIGFAKDNSQKASHTSRVLSLNCPVKITVETWIASIDQGM